MTRLPEDPNRRLVARAGDVADELRRERTGGMASELAVWVEPDRLVRESEDPLLGGIGLEAAPITAGSTDARTVGIDDDVTNAAGPAETAGEELTIRDDPGADPGRNSDIGEVGHVPTGAVVGLTERRCGGIEGEVVVRRQVSHEAAAQVVANPLRREMRGRGDESFGGDEGSDRDTDAGDRPDTLISALEQEAHRLEDPLGDAVGRARVRRWQPLLGQHFALSVDDRRLDHGPTHVESHRNRAAVRRLAPVNA